MNNCLFPCISTRYIYFTYNILAALGFALALYGKLLKINLNLNFNKYRYTSADILKKFTNYIRTPSSRITLAIVKHRIKIHAAAYCTQTDSSEDFVL